jgi:hypothetical protein
VSLSASEPVAEADAEDGAFPSSVISMGNDR